MRKATDIFALLIGAFLLIEGIWGLTSPVVFGVLTTNTLHAIIHLVLGLIGIAVGWMGRARGFCIFLGVLLLAVGVLRFVPGIDEIIVRLLNVNVAVAWVNIIVGAVALSLALFVDRRAAWNADASGGTDARVHRGDSVAPGGFPFDRGGMTMEKAMFGAGCFWGVETTFRNIKGVTSAAVGYAGGTTDNPTYQEVCSTATGHAEVVEVEFDPAMVSYRQLLEVFWANHDPTTMNRQGPDVGSQYRSVIFTYSPEQKTAAEASKTEMDASGRFRRPIVTQIEPAPKFFRGEEYHQRYLEKRGMAHCAI